MGTKAGGDGLRAGIAIAVTALVLTGCATSHTLMPTPSLYAGANAKPLFSDASISRRPTALDLLFITDRAPAQRTGDLPYTAGRSRSMAFGSVMIELGKDVTWDLLVEGKHRNATCDTATACAFAHGGERPVSADTLRARGRSGRNGACTGRRRGL